MQHKQYKIKPEDMAALSLADVEFYLDLETDFVFCYSFATLNAVCERSPALAGKFAIVLSEMAAAVDVRYDKEYLRPNCGALFDDKEYLTRLSIVARGHALCTDATTVRAEGFVPEIRETKIATGSGATVTNPADAPVPLYLPAADIGRFLQPTMLARCGLFRSGGSSKSVRESWTTSRPLVLNHFSGLKGGSTSVFYAGEELRSGDQEAWALLLNRATATALGEEVTVSLNIALGSVPGRGLGSNSRLWLRGAGQRLNNASLTIRTTDVNVIALMKKCFPKDKTLQDADKDKFVEISFNLLGSFTASNSSITYSLNRKLRAMFGDKISTWYDTETYYSLPKKGLSRRLYILYQSHYNCWPLTQAELVEYLGITAVKERSIRAELEKAHEELKVIEFLTVWELRKPTSNERLTDKLCFVVTRPNRNNKTVDSLHTVEA
jgi:hypothetical protein